MTASRTRLGALVLALALATWLAAIQQMRGMDTGPGTAIGALGFFLVVWVTMMAAMMLPSALPMILLFDRVSRERASRRLPIVSTWLFVATYFAIWTGFGLAAYAIYRIIAAAHPTFIEWTHDGAYLTGALVALAGLYELTPLKAMCLRHCRSPLHFVMGYWKNGRAGALRMGATHGSYCVGCCAGLMLILFALGVMSIFWMAVVALLIFTEKIFSFGQRLPYLFAVALVGLGLWVAIAPGSVPGLAHPHPMPTMHSTGRWADCQRCLAT